MPWEQTKEGWILELQVDEPDAEEEPLWVDRYLRIFLAVSRKKATYRVRIDQRRVYHCVSDPQWLALFFGLSAQLRPSIKGRRLWRPLQAETGGCVAGCPGWKGIAQSRC